MKLRIALLFALALAPLAARAQTSTYNFNCTTSCKVIITANAPNGVVCLTDNATIVLATDGQGHCTTGATYAGPITITTTKTYYAITGEPGSPDSPPSTATYTVVTPPPPPSPPVFSVQ